VKGALGASMMGLAALIHLPVRLLAGLSAAVILLHNLTDRVEALGFGSFGWIWNLLHQPGAISVGEWWLWLVTLCFRRQLLWLRDIASGMFFKTALNRGSERSSGWAARSNRRRPIFC
jgi:hypothetical protein